jgi:HK97 family phage prohead protease
MTTVEEMTQDTERPERASHIEVPGVAVRVFATELRAGAGRTVDVRIAPYGQRAKANDGLGGAPPGVMYEEEILPGAFDHQLNAANRVHLNYEHEPTILNIVGHGLSLASRADGLYGSFVFHSTPQGDTALELVRAGALGGVSFEAKFRKSVRGLGGVVQRVKANLVNVALCREPAYESAVILGLRTETEDDFLLDEALLPLPFNPTLAARVAAVSARLKAHPALGTPAETGTPESTPAEETDTKNIDTEEAP